VLLDVYSVTLAALLKEDVELFVQGSGFWRPLPHVVPVNICGRRGTCSDDIQYIFGSV
jgi:hypothetical protein